MEKNVEYVLMAVLVLVIIYALWYFFVHMKRKCKTSSDCKPDEVCSGGYCKSKGS